jgi:Beta-galactosidase
VVRPRADPGCSCSLSYRARPWGDPSGKIYQPQRPQRWFFAERTQPGVRSGTDPFGWGSALTPAGPSLYGPRQNREITNPHFPFSAERVIRRLVEPVKDQPVIFGFQVDNETQSYCLRGPDVQKGFVASLKRRFLSLAVLNHAYGLDNGSNRINAWKDLLSFNGAVPPSLIAAFAAYQPGLVTAKYPESQIGSPDSSRHARHVGVTWFLSGTEVVDFTLRSPFRVDDGSGIHHALMNACRSTFTPPARSVPIPKRTCSHFCSNRDSLRPGVWSKEV